MFELYGNIAARSSFGGYELNVPRCSRRCNGLCLVTGHVFNSFKRLTLIAARLGEGGVGAGRKRHILADTLGIPIANRVEAANMSDRRAAASLLGGLGK